MTDNEELELIEISNEPDEEELSASEKIHNKSANIKNKPNKRRKKHRKKHIRIPVIILSVIICIVLLIFILWRVLVYTGRINLYKKGGAISTELMAQLTDADTEVAEVGWQENWIRRNGKVYQYNDDLLTFLVLGIDHDGEVEEDTSGVGGGQADANFLLVINPDAETFQLICINRDCMTKVESYDYYGNQSATTTAQLSLAHAYGNSREENAENSVKAVSNLFYGIPIHGYCAINMAAIPQINDAVGGVTVESLDTFSRKGYSFVKGQKVTLRGMGAFYYVHDRNTKEFNSNGKRLARQKQYINAFMGRARTAVAKNPTLAVNLYNSLTPYMTTNISLDEVTYLVSTVLGYSFDINNIITLEGETVQGTYYEEFYPDEESLKELIIEIFYEEVK